MNVQHEPSGQSSWAPNLSPYDGKRIAVLINVGDQRWVFRGQGSYCTDQQLGPVLIIHETGATSCPSRIILTEATWQGDIAADGQYDCDYCFVPSLGGQDDS